MNVNIKISVTMYIFNFQLRSVFLLNIKILLRVAYDKKRIFKNSLSKRMCLKKDYSAGLGLGAPPKKGKPENEAPFQKTERRNAA